MTYNKFEDGDSYLDIQGDNPEGNPSYGTTL
jgi:hypothetical protein